MSQARKNNLPTPQTSGLSTDAFCQPDNSSHPELTERDYMTPIKDNHGHSDRVSFRLHPRYIPAMNNIVRSQKFPFRSNNDVIRFAIDRAVRFLEHSAGIPTMLRHIDAMKQVLLDEEAQIEFTEWIDRSQRNVQYHINRGSHARAARIVSEMKHHIDAMEDEYWRAQYLQELNARFKHLLNVTPGEGERLIGDVDEP